MPFWKNKRPEIVSWVEPKQDQNPTLFAVVWEDGVMYIYEKIVHYDAKENYKESLVQIRSNNGE